MIGLILTEFYQDQPEFRWIDEALGLGILLAAVNELGVATSS